MVTAGIRISVSQLSKKTGKVLSIANDTDSLNTALCSYTGFRALSVSKSRDTVVDDISNLENNTTIVTIFDGKSEIHFGYPSSDQINGLFMQ